MQGIGRFRGGVPAVGSGLVLAGCGADDDRATEAAPTAQVTAGGPWQGMSAVQQGRAFEVDDDRWFLAIGPLGARLVLDDLEQIANRLQS